CGGFANSARGACDDGYFACESSLSVHVLLPNEVSHLPAPFRSRTATTSEWAAELSASMARRPSSLPKQVMRDHPLASTLVAEQLGAGHEENAPSFVPPLFLAPAINGCEFAEDFRLVRVHV